MADMDTIQLMNGKMEDAFEDFVCVMLNQARDIFVSEPNATWGEIGWDNRVPKDTPVRSGVVFEGALDAADLEREIILAFQFDEAEDALYQQDFKDLLAPVEELIDRANISLRNAGLRGIVTMVPEHPDKIFYYVWDQPKPVPVTVQLEDDLSGYVRRYAENNNQTLSGVVNGAVEEWRNRQEREAQGLSPESTGIRLEFEDLRRELERRLKVEGAEDLIDQLWSVKVGVGLAIESDHAAHADALFTCTCEGVDECEIQLSLTADDDWDFVDMIL